MKRGRTSQRINLLMAGTALLMLSACAAPQAAPVHNLGTRVDGAAGAGVVMVRDGDTVWRISERYRLPLRDIIDINGMKPPYQLQTGQRLQLPPPNEHKTGAGDTVTGIARMYGVPVSQVVSVNKLSAPYQLREGQVLRIPSTVARPHVVVQARPVDVAPLPSGAATSATQARAQITSSAQNVSGISSTPVVSAPPQPSAAPVRVASAATSMPAAVASGTPSKQGFIWPVRGKVISSYGPKPGHLHNDGINIAAPRGAVVASAADGTVAYVGNDLMSYGNLVLIRHANGLVTAYAHLDRVQVRRGDIVRRGQGIGTVGSTGTVANPQLHFEVRRGIESLDPAKYLSL